MDSPTDPATMHSVMKLPENHVYHLLEDVLVTVIVFKWAFLNNVRVCVRSARPGPSFFDQFEVETWQIIQLSQTQLCTFDGVLKFLHSFHIRRLASLDVLECMCCATAELSHHHVVYICTNISKKDTKLCSCLPEEVLAIPFTNSVRKNRLFSDVDSWNSYMNNVCFSAVLFM